MAKKGHPKNPYGKNDRAYYSTTVRKVSKLFKGTLWGGVYKQKDAQRKEQKKRDEYHQVCVKRQEKKFLKVSTGRQLRRARLTPMETGR